MIKAKDADLQPAGQRLRLFYLLLHVGADTDDVPQRHLFSARAIAGSGAHYLRLAAPDQRGGDHPPTFHGPVAGCPMAARAGAGGLHGGGILGGAGLDAQAFQGLISVEACPDGLLTGVCKTNPDFRPFATSIVCYLFNSMFFLLLF